MMTSNTKDTRRLKLLLLTRPNLSLTGSGTYEANLLKTLGERFEMRLYRSEEDLDEQWDIVHCTNLKHLPYRLAKRVTAPLVVDLHDYYWVRYYHFFCPDFPIRFLLQKWRSLKYRLLFRHIDGLILHGRFLFDLIPHRCRYLNLYFGLDYSAIQPNRWEEREDLILFVGGDYFRKGLHRILKALPLLLERVPTARLLVIGREPLHSRIFARFLSLNLPVDYIHGMPREQLYRTYRRGKVLVLPSEIECTPLVIAEGTMAGLPPVVSNVGGHPELVQHGKTGFLFELDDTGSLVDQLERCLTDRELSERLVAEGQRFLGQFTLERMLNRLEEIYQDAINRKGGSTDDR